MAVAVCCNYSIYKHSKAAPKERLFFNPKTQKKMYYNQNTLVYLDGDFVPASQANAGLFGQTLHYGVGVFEGIRSYDTPDGTRVFRAADHYDRLKYSAEKAGLPYHWDSKELTDATYKLLEKNNLKNAYIRPLVYADPMMSLAFPINSHLFIAAWEWALYQTKALRLTVSPYRRPDPRSCVFDAKVSGYYVNSILASSEAKSRGFDDALLLDVNGFVAEGPGANFFFEKNEKLYTSPKGNILPGITRDTVFQIAAELGLEVVEKHFTPEELKNADAAFFCGTAAEVTPVASVDDVVFKANWDNTASALVKQKYTRRVAFNEYANFTMVI
jgi:branched-chain amino acid aminotransferase